MSKNLDITDNKYNRFTAISRSGNKNTKGSWLWNFKCDCGSIKELEAYAVTSGAIKSCGCYAREVTGKATITHGFSNSDLYDVWRNIKGRILNTLDHNYPKYGGRGLKIEDRWVYDMESFYDHLGSKPDLINRYTVGRIDNDIGYIIGNIRWETYHSQAHNKRKKITNTSNVTGVVWAWKGKKSQATYAVARWQEGVKQCTKTFAVAKYGLLQAFKLACEYRELMIEQLNMDGHNYAIKHGK